jgi:tetratricopeptide (TPR) repeat protein
MPGNMQAFQKAMDQGHSAAWDQNWAEAAEFYRKALGQDPQNVTALSSLALALFELGELDEALKIYQQLVRLSPNDSLPMEKIARIFERQGRLKEAIQTYMHVAEMYLRGRDVEKAIENWTRITSLQGEHFLAHNRLASVFDRMGRKADAVAEYLAIASILQSQGELSKATQMVEYAVNLMPENKDAQQALHTVRAGLKLPKPARGRGGTGPVRMAAVKQLEQMPVQKQLPDVVLGKQQDPLAEARQKALEALAILLFEQTDDTSTAQTKRNLSALTKGTGSLNPDYGDRARIALHVSQAIESQTQGFQAEAVEELSRAVEIGLRSPAVYFDLGFLQVENKPQDALRNLQYALRNPEYNLAASLLMSKIYFKLEQYKDAADLAIQALRTADIQTASPEMLEDLNPQYESVMETIHIEADMARLKDISIQVSEHLLRPDWRQHLSSARQQLDGSIGRAALADLFLASGSSRVVEALARVRSLAREGKLASAVEEAYYALQFAPTYLPLHLEIGELFLQEGQVNDAVAKYTIIADLYSLRGETAQANHLFKRILQASPMDMGIRARLIDSLTTQGLVEEALQQSMELAQIHYQLTDLDKARQTYANALRLAQQSKTNRVWSAQILTKVADIDMQRLDLRQAMRVYEQLRTVEPEDPNVRSQLADLYFRTGQDNLAVSEVETVSGLLVKSGKYVEAADFLGKIITEHPQHLELNKRLAEIYIQMGKNENAIGQLAILVNLYLDNADKANALATLQHIIQLNPRNIEEYREAARGLSAG